MRLTFFRGIAVGSALAIALLAMTSAVAGTGVGAVFNLGQKNKVNAVTSLSGSASGPMLKLTNSGRSTALRLNVGRGRAPLTVNSAARVANLNASLLRGLGPAAFVQGGGQNRAFALTLTDQDGVKLVSIPGYGFLDAGCLPGGVPFADVNYVNGPRSVNVWSNESSTNNTAVNLATVPPFGAVGISSLGGANEPSWAEAMISYATGSGKSAAQRVATVTVALNFDGSTCKFAAQALAGPGRVAP